MERLRTIWLTPAAVLLLLFGSLVLDNWAVTAVAAVLLVAGLVLMPRERMRGGTAAIIGIAVAAALVVLLRSIR